MERHTLSSRLTRIGDEIHKLTNTLDAMRVTDTETYGHNYEELSLDAALRAEKNCLFPEKSDLCRQSHTQTDSDGKDSTGTWYCHPS
ncbi:MAG: DUF6100 family protein [Eisenbergiella massiliensis]